MKGLHPKKSLSEKSISEAAIAVQSQIKLRPFVTNSTSKSQELNDTPKQAKLQKFNFAQIPIFPAIRADKSQGLQPKQASNTLKDMSEVNLAPSSGGQTMPKLVQQKMETSFGTDFSDVRIHEGSQAEKIGALAYTQGQNIHFQPGKYQPTTESGQKLLGHELAHVEQQRAGRVTAPQSKGVAINTDPQLESEADVLGTKAAQGEPAQVTETASFGVQRMPTQGNVVQCAKGAKQQEGQEQSSGEEGDTEGEINSVLETAYTGILNDDLPNASQTELLQIVGERSLISPVAEQMRLSPQLQEQAESTEEPEASSSFQSKGQELQSSTPQSKQVEQKIEALIEPSNVVASEAKKLEATMKTQQKSPQPETDLGQQKDLPSLEKMLELLAMRDEKAALEKLQSASEPQQPQRRGLKPLKLVEEKAKREQQLQSGGFKPLELPMKVAKDEELKARRERQRQSGGLKPPRFPVRVAEEEKEKRKAKESSKDNQEV